MAGGRSSHCRGASCRGASCRGASCRGARLRALALAGVVAVSFAATSAQGFDAFDGRLQAHGAFSSQLRALNGDYSEQWDVSQWYMIFNLEVELDLVQDTVGPIDLMSAFVRAEVRYDCIYSRGCGTFRSMNAYGDRSKSLPRRLLDLDRVRHSGRIRIPNDPELPDQFRNSGSFRSKVPGSVNDAPGNEFFPRPTNRDPLTAVSSPTLGLFAGGGGGDALSPRDVCAGDLCNYLAGGDGTPEVAANWPNNDSPYDELARAGGYGDFEFIVPGGAGFGPWLPKNFFQSNATHVTVANPFDARVGGYALQASVYNASLIDANPDTGDPVALNAAIALATAAGQAAVGAGELPYRPVPFYREDGAGVLQAPEAGDARGLFIPSQPLAERLNRGGLADVGRDYNFSQSQRAWNRGASQKDEKELKEAYLDIEMFESQLWLRIGKQQIVWGKTELFRTTDQFNPTDLALASLPSLEESRIALWSARGVWSFYEVGPLDDVRLELAFIFDDYQQSDLGACGEPYAPNVVCNLTFGSFVHGLFGVGLAGIEEPPTPWQSLKGWEVGARLEWRYDQFSFALMDFYGYDDLPVIEQISTFTRNVDPRTGRPREIFGNLATLAPSVDPYTQLATNSIEQLGSQGVCETGLEPACLLPKEEALTHSAVAQQLYAYTCATTVGFSSLDRSACALNVLGSQEDVIAGIASVAQGVGALLAGSPLVNTDSILGLGDAFGGFKFPFVTLSVDARDLPAGVEGARPGAPPDPATNGSAVPCLDGGTACGGQGTGLLRLAGTSNGDALIFSETLGGVLSPEQEALLGCGAFWGTQCDDSGIDLLTAEGSALFQSWPGVEGTVRGGDITALWHTNQKVISATTGGEVFAQQPGTRGWYFDSTRRHDLGPVCTTANFGGALYANSSDPLGNDEANGNQAVLPGCHRKWKRDPDDPAFAGSQRILALNLYGQDLVCARERAANGGSTTSADCTGLGDFNSERVDPRSWQADRDGEPDALSMQYINFVPGQLLPLGLGMRQTNLPPARLIAGDSTVVPDFFYGRPLGLQVFGPGGTSPASSAAGLAFDECNTAAYSAGVIEDYGGADFVPCGKGGHPMTGQPWSSEMAAVSWNFMVLLIQQELTPTYDAAALAACGPVPDTVTEAYRECAYPVAREIFLPDDIASINGECNLLNPALCDTWRTLQGAIGLQRNVRRAGGNGSHGRRTFVWQSGGEAVLSYNKRNVLGFSMDFAEDVSKSNFSFEFTWIEGLVVGNNNEYDGLSQANDFNLTMSADRPTFINFLNSNRTFFFNWQLFVRYREGWEKGFGDEGPWSFLTTFAASTAYFQDRLAPSAVVVYDIGTQSGAFLPQISYRFTQNFSAAFGMAYFFGKPDYTDQPLTGIAPAGNASDRDSDHLYKSRRNGGLAIVSDRDEIWARIRYTF